jgi:hypothetical protein
MVLERHEVGYGWADAVSYGIRLWINYYLLFIMNTAGSENWLLRGFHVASHF